MTLLAILAVVGLSGCAGAPPRAALASESPPPTEPVPATSVPPEEDFSLPPADSAVAPAPAECKISPLSSEPCGAGVPLEKLADALELSDWAARDRALAPLESCEDIEPGLVRTLRVDLVPNFCADVWAEGYLAQQGASLRIDVRDALSGLALSARLSRLALSVPVLEGEVNRERFLEFFRGQLGRWIVEQARALYATAKLGAQLQGYGRGVVAVAAGVADMRFVEAIRTAPLPVEIASDEELRDVYFGQLDQALGPIKTRGRDGALVGLRRLAETGSLGGARVVAARALLSTLYGGRRIDALDELLLPELPESPSGDAMLRVAEHLPVFYSPFLLDPSHLEDEPFLRALSAKGIPSVFRKRLDRMALPYAARDLYARVLLRLGQTYWLSADFTRAASLLSAAPTPGAGTTPQAQLVGAVATALQHGPKDAADMMVRGPLLPDGVGNVAELDRIAKSKSPVAGLAAYNAAYILSLVPPVTDDGGYWSDVARRFKKAVSMLKQPKHKALARRRAESARATATAIRRRAPPKRLQ